MSHKLGTRRAIARLNGRNTKKPDAWRRPVPPHRYRSEDRSCSELQPSSDATPCLWHGDVEGIHEGRALSQRQGKPGSAGWLGPFSGAGTHKAT